MMLRYLFVCLVVCLLAGLTATAQEASGYKVQYRYLAPEALPLDSMLTDEVVALPLHQQRSKAMLSPARPLTIAAGIIYTDWGPVVVRRYKDPMSVRSSRVNGLETCFSPVGISCSYFW